MTLFKRLILFVAFIFSFSATAQYSVNRYTIPTGKNPGGVKVDYEIDNQSGYNPDPGWTLIPFPASANGNTWSLPVQIPFTFNFNGIPVTDFIFHRTGVITFDITTSIIPPVTNEIIPSASIPDKSVVMWGFNTNTYNVPQYRVYGSAPNRQLWIYYKYARFINNGNNFLWSFVLEEGTDNIYVVHGYSRVWANNISLTVGVQIDNQTAYSVAPATQLPVVTAMQGSPEDNTYYEFSHGTAPFADASVASVSFPQYKLINVPDDVKYNFINKGSSPITDLTLKYSYQGNVYNDNKTALNIVPGQTVELTHAVPLALTQTSAQPLSAWVEYTGDSNPANDIATTMVSGLSFTPDKKVLYECTQGVWCTWNDLGFQYVDSIYTLFPSSTELISIQESPAITDLDYVNGAFKLHAGVPVGYVDRKYIGTLYDENFTYIPLRQQQPTPCDISTQTVFDPVTRNLDINLSAHFGASLNGDYRFNAVIVEEGCDADPATHDRSARIELGGFDGQPNSLPFVINDGDIHNYTFSYVIPQTWDISRIHVVGWVCDKTSSFILNTSGSDITTDVNSLQVNGFDAQILGNPVTASSQLKVVLEKDATIALQILDMNGKLITDIAERHLISGSYYFNIGSKIQEAGIYLVKINADGATLTRKFAVE